MPPSDDVVETFAALSFLPHVGPITSARLLERFGTPAAILQASAGELAAVEGIGPSRAPDIVRARGEALRLAREEIASARRDGFGVLTPGVPDFPAPLRHMPDPPSVLYVRGEYREEDGRAVSVVGSRRATRYGRTQAERIAGDLARRGYTVVSGLARGIDRAAHEGALGAGGRTIAILGSGLRRLYPPEHRELADAIAANGAVLSEFPLDTPPDRGNFPRRNRLISALSLGTVVVEADDKSGALITARFAAEQGREVFAFPGPVDSPASRGTHALIRDGAKLVSSVEDIIEEFYDNTPASPKQVPALEALPPGEKQVLDTLSEGAADLETIAVRTGLDIPDAAAALTRLELKRLVRRYANGYARR
ncbi:MAG: DNA-processing protein DprA [Planctomycetota bacterium]